MARDAGGGAGGEGGGEGGEAAAKATAAAEAAEAAKNFDVAPLVGASLEPLHLLTEPLPAH